MLIVNKNKKRTSERVLLSEVTSASQFLMKVDNKTNIKAAKEDVNIPIYLFGIIQRGDAINKNRRLYPWTYLKKECERYLEEEVKNGQSYGELDHPEEAATPRLTHAAMTIEDILFKGKEVFGLVKILNAYTGPGDPAFKARSIILNNKILGISSRALGSLIEEEDHDIVDEDLEIACWDLVGNPSTHGANLKLSESRSKRKKKLLTESVCFPNKCDCGCYIQRSKVETLTEAEKVSLNVLGVERFLQIKKMYEKK